MQVVVRDRIPEFFVGFKYGGNTPVWSHARRLAKALPYNDFEKWQTALFLTGEVAFPIWTDLEEVA